MPDASTILAAVLLAVVPSLVYLAILNAIDRYEKEPWTILLACLGVGAIVAPALSLAILVLAGRSAVLPPAFAPGSAARRPRRHRGEPGPGRPAASSWSTACATSSTTSSTA